MRARDNYQAAGVLRRVLEGDEALDAVEPPLLVGLVHVAPALVRLLDPPAWIVAIGSEDTSTIQRCHQVLRTPQVRKGLLHPGERPEKPEHLRLPDASAVDDPVRLPRRPAVALLLRVPPGAEVRPGDGPRVVGALDEVPEQAVGHGDLLLIRDAGEDHEALVRQVSEPAVPVGEVEALGPDRTSNRHPWHLLAHVKDHVDVPADFPNDLVELVFLRMPGGPIPSLPAGIDRHLVAHLLHSSGICLEPKLGQDG
mmetsp:Transcript_34546/g.99134  ORF Transcript_34546/g.99134 Transcript_34546/m.99134 type:complete len:254 (-) Transcript_34546:1334-2095(-)